MSAPPSTPDRPTPDRPRPDSFAALRYPEFRWLLLSSVAETLAARGLAIVIAFQLYQVTRSPLALGWLGLVEAAPALGLALLGGHIADRADRRRIILLARSVLTAAALLMSLVSALLGHTAGPGLLAALYALVFASGLARGFGDPAGSAFETQIVPVGAYLNASSWLGSASLAASMLGPPLGGVALAALGAPRAYLGIAALHLLAALGVFFIAPRPVPPRGGEAEPFLRSVREGVQFVARDPVLYGSMALDLFAVLFGGAVALLPVFADDILRVGPQGLGLLVAAPSVGALLVTLWATRRPPARHAGRTLLLCVAGFGVSIIVFALSKNLWLSLVALAFSGAFDGVSMVIRRAILRLRTPDHLRGRVGAVSLLFIGSSNEIGAFESGFAANLLGTARSVWLGGLVTLGVVAFAALRLKPLRELDLTPADAAASAEPPEALLTAVPLPGEPSFPPPEERFGVRE